VPLDSLQFVHSANLFLDRQPEEPGTFPATLQETLEDATLSSFEHVVSTCIENAVDFLLLTGNSFDESEKSLRARVALRDGFFRLACEDIRVFIMPGRTDPPEAWRTFPDLPDNVTLFLHRNEEPVAVIREGRVIATIAHLRSDESESDHSTTDPNTQPDVQSKSTRTSPFRIGISLPKSDDIETALPMEEGEQGNNLSPESLCFDRVLSLWNQEPIDYLALGGTLLRRTIVHDTGIAHHPGGTQGWDPQQTGLHGCTLVHVDANGEIQTRFVPTSIVRWEQFRLEIDPETSREQLLDNMLQMLNNLPGSPTEKIRINQWMITGSGPVFESLCDASHRTELAESVGEEASRAENPFTVHTFFPLQNHRTEPITPLQNEGSLFQEFLALLEEHQPLSQEMITVLFDEAHLPAENWTNRLRSLGRQCDLQSVEKQAEQLGMSWFSLEPSGEELP